MNTGESGRPKMALRSSKSVYGSKTMPGVKGSTVKAGDRKTLLKAPKRSLAEMHNVTNQCRTIPRIVKTGVRETSITSKAFTTNKKQNLMSVKFVRPSVDMMAARKRMIERNMRLGEVLIDSSSKTNADHKNKIIMGKLNMGHTPKQSTLSSVYQKLGESIKKSAQSVRTVRPSPPSPFEELLIQKKKTQNPTQTANNNNNNNVVKCLEDGTQMKKSGLPECNNAVDKIEGMQANRSPIRSVYHASKDESDFTLAKVRSPFEIKPSENSRQCALTNVIKHCGVYSKKLSDVIDGINCLDESFQRVIIAETGGRVYSKFCEYQKKKMELEKQIKAIEEELEEAVRNELDVKMKFQEYLNRKTSKWKEESALLEEFKSTVNNLITKYEEELSQPKENKNLEEIVEMLISSSGSVKKDVDDIENRGFVLRRSKRLLSTPKTPDTSMNCSRVLRSSCGKKDQERNSDVKDSSKKRREKGRIQRNLYTDLQKRFQLFSPEQSF